MKVLVLNSGSSSIKYQLFEMPAEKVIAKGIVQRIGEQSSEAHQQFEATELQINERIENHEQALQIIEDMLTDQKKGPLRSMTEIKACGHRVVHGSEMFTGSAKLNKKIEQAIEDNFDLAPLHNPANLAGIRAAQKKMGNIPQVVCFDTAFHQTMPEAAYLYALPYEMYQKYKIRKYGFHGISHRYVARRAAALLMRDKYEVDLITCHLGNGCSITAVKNGVSVDTSMGLTPLEGLVMGTRSGDLDPAIILQIMHKEELTPNDATTLLNKHSGLIGVSGISSDMREIEEEYETNERARVAHDIFTYRLRKYIGAYAAAMGGVDVIVFTGGIGENSAMVREHSLQGLEFMGVNLDKAKNEASDKKEREISTDDSKVKVFVIPTNEELVIAMDTMRIVHEMKH